MMVKKILFITLSNIGDCILTLPVLDTLREAFLEARITCISGIRARDLFENNPYIEKVIIYDKRSSLKEKIALFSSLKKEKFDMVVDLRNSFFGAFLPAKYKISPFLAIPQDLKHMQSRHLYKLRVLLSRIKAESIAAIRETSLFIKEEDKAYVKKLLEGYGVLPNDQLVVISAGAKSHIKRWSNEKFAQLASLLIREFGVKIILVGDKDDKEIAGYIEKHCVYPVVNLAAKTNLLQLAFLLKKSRLLVTNDSANLHMASYLNIPVIGIFGPTNETKYGPWSDRSGLAKKDIACRPCEKALCRFGTLKCMQLVRVEDALAMARDILNTSYRPPILKKYNFKRILIMRTDRIGDVILSTPVIKNIRDSYPHAYIAMMVSPYAKETVEGNPYLDEVIIYDKDGKHKSWGRAMKFAQNLKKKKFDLVIVLHPANYAHLVAFFAGIPKRIGYDRKLGFLLTDKIKHTKQLGQKHELEYNLDLVKYLEIPAADKKIFMPIKPESEKYVDVLFKDAGIVEADKLLVVNPGASCPSKIWPAERFALVADRLAKKYGFKVLIIAGPKDIALAKVVAEKMHTASLNLAGKTSVSQLASVLKRCRLFISNDSGPVHVASAVGVPVISIFGRNQKGLGPLRWGPVGKKDRYLHKESGCISCLAHNCVKGFACLKAITVDDVIGVAEEILGK